MHSTSNPARLTLPPALPPGTRLVLEIPDPAAPGGYRCETPLIGSLVAALAPAVVQYVAAVRAEKVNRAEKARREAEQASVAPDAAADPVPPLEAAAPVCPKCTGPKTRVGGGRWMCRPCQSQAVAAGHQARSASRKAA